MRKLALFVIVSALLSGCGGGTTSPMATSTPSPEPLPLATPTTETAIADRPTDNEPSADDPSTSSATCVAEALDFPVLSGIPPITENDHIHGPADASITIIEYADFQ